MLGLIVILQVMRDFQTPKLGLLIKMVEALPVLTDEFIGDFNHGEADRMLEVVREHIDNQDLGWEPLSEAYAEFKRHEGLSEKTWVSTGELKSRLAVHENEFGALYIGGAKGEIHEFSGMELNKLIGILEDGNLGRGLPARNLFGPSRREASKGITRRFASATGSFVKNRLKNIFQ